MRFTRLLVVSVLCAAFASRADGQNTDTLRRPPIPPATASPDSLPRQDPDLRPAASPLAPATGAASVRLAPPPRRDTVARVAAPELAPLGRLAPMPGDSLARRRVAEVRATRQRLLDQAWRRATMERLIEQPAPAEATATPDLRAAEAVAAAEAARPPADSARAGGPIPPDIFGDYADLGLDLQARLEAKAERQKNERCQANQVYLPGANCEGIYQPQFDFQFNVRTGGVVADRVHVNVDYDSQREFDASNNISVYYQGKPDELLERLEVGNVSFQPTPSRFITSGIPSGNYGIQAIGQLGPMRFRTIVAQQKGNVVKDRVFTVGDRTLQTLDRDIEDYQVEPRRFFWTIDPRQLQGYPNIDILDGQRLAQLAAQLPADQRPTKVYLYRQTIAGPQPNPQGPQFLLAGSRSTTRQLFEYLREGVDYYVDPSNLWVALVRPISLQNERLAVAYTIGNNVTTPAGGTPALSFEPEEQRANLLFEPNMQPADTAGVFWREIRSVYRLGGEDINRGTVALRITTGAGDQEKPVSAGAATYLQQFGIAQPSNPSVFDVDNRLWPRPSDPNYNRDAGGNSTKLIRDYFVVFPSLRPFAAAGLAEPPNPANDTIYTTPGEDLYSARRPPTLYHIRARYQAEGGGETGTLLLGGVQVRQNSERIVVGGVPLVRGADYTVDYELGRVTFTRPDTLFVQPRQVQVQYEENPLFAAAPTSIFGIAAEFPMTNGQLNVTAISQSQKTTFNRPPLGFEPASSFVAGVSGHFDFDASLLTRGLERLPFSDGSAPSRISISGEVATSRPQPNAAGQAYVESFEGEGGLPVILNDAAWYYSSLPPASPALDAAAGLGTLVPQRAAALTWQNNGFFVAPGGATEPGTFTLSQIDPQVVTSEGSYEIPEQLLYLTLHPLSTGGAVRNVDGRFEPRWTVGDAPGGRRWRSLRVSLSPSGADLSRVETLEFWALVYTQNDRLTRNPVVAFDFGEISENSLAFAPETLTVAAGGTDSTYTGKQLVGLDTLHTERDEISRQFNSAQDDVGLPGDVARGIVVVDPRNGGPVRDTVNVCTGEVRQLLPIGDSRVNCTVRNNRLDEEDLDQDFTLSTEESWHRFVVDLSDARNFARVGGIHDEYTGGFVGGQPEKERKHWVLVKVPFRVPNDSLGSPNVRRVRALRLTMVTGAGRADTAIDRLAIARMRLVGSPWLKRANTLVRGIAGDEPAGGTVLAGMVGTQDRDSTGLGLDYQSPPGVTDQTDTKQTGYESGRFVINERSLRLLAAPAADVQQYDRAESYFRFPEGQKSFMGYEQLRVWARGRGRGWGSNGALQFFVKIGRDASNFYLYRTPVNSGGSVAAWTPEVVVDFRRFFELRERVQNAYLQGGRRNTCTGLDSALIARSRLPDGYADSTVFAACSEGYVVLTTDPAVSPPNLAAVQELAVGMVRLDSAAGTEPILPGDTLELWVDDIRLTGVINTPGYAGQVGLDVVAGDLGTVRLNLSRRDPNFRQLGEQPTFLTDNAFDIATSLRLDKLLPRGLGFSLPFSVSHSGTGSDPAFLQNTDLRGSAIQGLRTPQASATAFALDVRRSIPITGVFAPVVNNLSVGARYATGSAQSEYAKQVSHAYNFSADYRLAAGERSARLPGWADRLLGALPGFVENSEPVRAFRRSAVRWSPTNVAFTSALARNDTRSLAFQKPASTTTDSARVAENLQHLWRNGGAIEFRPWGALGLRWTAASVRDMRRYQDSLLSDLSDVDRTAASPALVAAGERDRLLGLDIGLERERQMSSGLSFAPQVSPWMRPRLEFSTQYNFLRNPGDRTVLREGDSTGAFRLPRRFSNSQSLNVGVTFDPARALALYTGDSSRIRRLQSVLNPVDLSWNRSLRSAFDGVAFSPDLGYQFALGNLGSFLRTNGRLASDAGVTRTLSAGTRFVLPAGTGLAARFQRNTTTSFARRLDGTQGRVDGLTMTSPDLTFTWNWTPRLEFLRPVLASVGANVGYQRTFQRSVTRGEASGLGDEVGESRGRRYPANMTVTWAPLGGLSTAFSYALADREDARPGTTNSSRTEDMGADLGKSFPLPASWNTQGDLRARLSWQASHTQSFVRAQGEDVRESRLTDNGRQAFNLNAETDFAQDLTGSLTLSRVITFDNNSDRRFSQTVISAVLNLRFFAGELH